MRYLMTFSYDGTNYNGYQKQPDKCTIQDNIEKALTKINGNKNVIIHASGRTDAKVHALNQKAHFDLDMDIEPENLKKAINSLVGNDIYVKNIKKVEGDFHARFNVLKKEYVYKINLGEYNPIERNYVYQYNKPLNIEKIKVSSKFLIGEHNFKSFTKNNDLKNDYVRTIYDINIKLNNNILSLTFIGNGFLRYMVRNIVGTLIEIGEEKREIDSVKQILENENRIYAGKTASPVGLYLKDVKYE